MASSVKVTDFSGGISTLSSKSGIANSARFIKGLNIFEDPNYATLSKATTKISSTTVTDLVYWFADGSPWDTNRYAYDASGNIYSIDSSDTVTSERTVSGGAGEGLVTHDNALYYALGTNIGRYYPLDNSPSFDDDITSWHNTTDLQTTGGGTGSSDYTPPTSISETATNRQTVTLTQDPVTSIVIDVDVVGTGDWTVTLHDVNNRSVGSKQITNGSMSTGDVTFTFDSPLRVEPDEAYHFHVTSTVADGGVDTDTATDLEGAEFTVNYDALIDVDFHPMARFFGGWVVGNERYLGFFDNIGGTYDPTHIKLDPGFEIRTIYPVEEYIVCEAWKGQNFNEAEEAKRYFWDGVESSYVYAEPIEVGVPNATTNYRNEIAGVYGNRGSVYMGSRPFSKIIDEVPKLTTSDTVEIYPGAISEYQERLVIGYSGVTTDGSGLEQGVYEFGSQSSDLANTLNYPYLISTGTTQGTNLKIGSVKGFGQDLLIGWRDSSTYGIDKVELDDNSTNETGSWESRIFDGGDPNKTKQAIKLEITFESLVSGDSVTPKYDINRSGSFTTGTAATTVGDTEVDLFINSQFKEIEFGFDLSTTANTFPKVTGVNFIYEPLEDEDETE